MKAHVSGVIRSRMSAPHARGRKVQVIRFVLVVAVAVTAIAIANALASDLVLSAVATLAIVGAFLSLPR